MGVATFVEPRIADPRHVVAARQEPSDGHRVGRVALHPQGEGPEAAQDQEAVERPGHAAHRVLEEPEPLGDGVARGDRDAEDRVRVPAEVLGGRMEHDVGAELERPLEGGRGERVVDDDERRRLAGLRRAVANGRGRRRDIGDLEQRIRRRLEPDEAGSGGQALPQRVVARREVDVARGPAARGPVHALEVAVGAAVDVVADEDLVARARELGDRRGRRRAAGERDPVPAALEVGDGSLEPLARGVLAPRVLVAAARPADAVLGERRGLVDRRRYGPGGLIGLGPGVDRAGGERVGRVGRTRRARTWPPSYRREMR